MAGLERLQSQCGRYIKGEVCLPKLITARVRFKKRTLTGAKVKRDQLSGGAENSMSHVGRPISELSEVHEVRPKRCALPFFALGKGSYLK